MGLRVKQRGDGSICASDMQNGDSGEIVACEVNSYIGSVVCRSGKRLERIGQRDCGWDGAGNLPPSFRVRLLQPGDELVYEE